MDGVSALISQTSFGGETSGSIGKCRLFSQANSDIACNRLSPIKYMTLVVTFHFCTESDNKTFLKNKAAVVFSLIFVCDYPEKVS